MQGGRDPFSGSGNPFGGFGGFGGQGNLVSSFFGGRDPFDDPFFTNPFGNMLGSGFGSAFGSTFGSAFETGVFGPNGGAFMNPASAGFLGQQPHQLNRSRGGPVIESGVFGPNGGPFMYPASAGFLEQQPHQLNGSRGGPVIEELSSDDEEGEKESGQERKDNSRKHGRSSNEPIVEYPDDETAEKKIKMPRNSEVNQLQNHVPRNSEMNQLQHHMPRPQSQSFTFQSSSVSYGGANGTYYTSSRTRRSGSDGLTFEESKEADSSTGQASHRVSKGIHEKGHSVTRKLKSDGQVDTMQTLHNLNEAELVNFEEAWQGNARRNLTGFPGGFATGEVMGPGSSSRQMSNRGGWALPSTERASNQPNLPPSHVRQDSTGPLPSNPGRRINIDGPGSTRFRSNGTGYSNRF